MSQFFISCKESRIENNRSFYGCFHLGPFEPSQSITIANALRRTLLSDIYGLGIISVEIEGATHEYSSLPGVKDSVLDLLLNFKEIVLKKNIKNVKPQVGYLRARGPGIVRASDLILPPFIQCVDPEQYIATLAENGFLNVKFVIQYGNKWISNSLSKTPTVETKGFEEITKNNAFNFNLKKRRLILKKLKSIALLNKTGINDNSTHKNSYTSLFTDSLLFLSKYKKKRVFTRKILNVTIPISKKYAGINLKTILFKKLTKSIEKKNYEKSLITDKKTNLYKKTKKQVYSQTLNKKMVFLNSNPLTIDAIFNPITKINYIIDTHDFKTSSEKFQISFETSDLFEMFKNPSSLNEFSIPDFLEKDLKTYLNSHPIYKPQDVLSINKIPNSLSQNELETLLELKRDLNSLKKDTLKHNLILEIWTNGSIHPRDALYQGFKSLIKLFSNLKKTNTLRANTTALKSFFTNETIPTNQKILNTLTKKIKMGDLNSTILQDLVPLNETSFLSSYIEPKLKNYFLKNESLSIINKIQSVTPFTVEKLQLNLKTNSNNFESRTLNKERYYKTDIGVLNLSLRSYTSLKRLKINTIEELLQFSKNDPINYKKLGKLITQELEKSLQDFF